MDDITLTGAPSQWVPGALMNANPFGIFDNFRSQAAIVPRSQWERTAMDPPYNLSPDDLDDLHREAERAIEALHIAGEIESLALDRLHLHVLSGAVDVANNASHLSDDDLTAGAYDNLIADRVNQMDIAITAQKGIGRGWTVPMGPGAYYDSGFPDMGN